MAKRSKTAERRRKRRRWRWESILNPADGINEDVDNEGLPVTDHSSPRHDKGRHVLPAGDIIEVEAFPIGPSGPGETDPLFPATLDLVTGLLVPDDYTAWERACERMPMSPVAIGVLHGDVAMLGMLDHSIVQMHPDTLLAYVPPPRLKRRERLALEFCDGDVLGPDGLQRDPYGISLPEPWVTATKRRKSKRRKKKARNAAG